MRIIKINWHCLSCKLPSIIETFCATNWLYGFRSLRLSPGSLTYDFVTWINNSSHLRKAFTVNLVSCFTTYGWINGNRIKFHVYQCIRFDGKGRNCLVLDKLCTLPRRWSSLFTVFTIHAKPSTKMLKIEHRELKDERKGIKKNIAQNMNVNQLNQQTFQWCAAIEERSKNRSINHLASIQCKFIVLT